ncbi:MAG: type I 3-dehydroquinate dehydratase, partial [Bacteroidales bacterium]|nr:type I 3-dehydroquinate dehydratase [Candidatus Hennigimonas equi]
MICCSIGNRTAGEILSLLDQVEMAEIRLDLCRLSDDDIEEVFSSDVPLIATYRTPQGGDYREAERQLALAVRYGARYLDLEIEAPKPVSKRLASACAQWGTTMIRSYHNIENTPSIDELKGIADKCRHHDGEIVKIVTFARDEADNGTVLDLYKYYTAESLVAFAMGPVGMASRLECLRRGAPFSYAAPCSGAGGTAAPSDGCQGNVTAPGQMSYEAMYKEVYGHRGVLKTSRVRMPSSKSYAQRAILAAALADGVSVLKGYTECSDNASALAVAAQLGAGIRRKRGAAGTTTLEITGIGPAAPGTSPVTQEAAPVTPGKPVTSGNAGHRFNVGESGLLARLMMPLGCFLYPEGFTVNGEG